jgi:phage tail P2-like protein
MGALKMSKTIYDVTLCELLPENLRSNPDIIAASQVMDKEFSQMLQAIKNCITYADVDNVRSDVLDLMAVESDIDFYDQTMPIEYRRQAVKEADQIHQINGTKAALLRVFELLSMRGVIEEWFEYGDSPYRFRIAILEISDRGLTAETNSLLDKLINLHKNVRSKLTGLNIYLTVHGKTPCYAVGVMLGEEITVYPWNVAGIESVGNRYTGIGYQSVETVDIYPL